MKLRVRELDMEGIRNQALQAKEEWLGYHLRKLLGNDLCDRALTEPAIVRTVMKEQSIWLREKPNGVSELMQGETVYSKFILEIKT